MLVASKKTLIRTNFRANLISQFSIGIVFCKCKFSKKLTCITCIKFRGFINFREHEFLKLFPKRDNYYSRKLVGMR